MYLQTFFPLIFTTYTYQIENMLFGMYFWITTAFVHTKNTYLFAKYLFGMYLQTFFPLIFTTYTYQIVNMQFGMYFYIPTVFLIIKNTYHFVNYQFGMYLQTNFPFNLLFHTYQIANTPVWYVFLHSNCIPYHQKHIPFCKLSI